MRNYRHLALSLTSFALMGCTTPEMQELSSHVERTTDDKGWRVDCNYDETSDMRRCFIGGFGETEHGKTHPFQVSYFNSDGPYVTLFGHDDPSSKAVVRVDDNDPVRLTNLNRYMAGKTARALRRETDKLIPQLKAGDVARVRTVRFPSDYADFKVNLNGFGDAYEHLQREVSEES